MGCGSSTTTVKTFETPKQDSFVRKPKTDRQNGSAKHDRKSASTKSRGSVRSLDKRPSSSSSSSSNDSVKSRDKKHRKHTPENDRVTSGGSQRNIGSGKQRNKHETEDNMVMAIKLDNKGDDEKDIKHDNNTMIIKSDEGFSSIHYRTTEQDETEIKKKRQEQHETIAKTKEERRAKVNVDEKEEKVLHALGLVALAITKMEEETTDNNFTIDDIANHNTEVGRRDWFKYGRKVYSVEKLIPVVKERMTLFIEGTVAKYREDSSGDLFDKPELHAIMWALNDNNPDKFEQTKALVIEDITNFKTGYPIFLARNYGVTRKDLKNVLSVCFIGNIAEIDHQTLIVRLKQSVENTLEALEENTGESVNDFKDQLNRWLQEYPNVPTKNEPPKAGEDPNEQTFPLPQAILFDPLILRKWIQEWESFDTELSGEVPWTVTEPQNEDLGDCHEIFANIVKEHVDENIPELDMAIDGEAAWSTIETDILKNDITTEEQEKIWKLRERRTNLNDPKWMERRRAEMADSFIARHQMDPNVISPFLSFAENMEISWKKFLDLCDKEFVPPVRKLPSSPKGENLETRKHSVESNTITDNINQSGNWDGPDTDHTNDDIGNNEIVVTGEANANMIKHGDDDEDENKSTFMTLTEEEINEANKFSEIHETDNNVLILDNDKSDPDNYVLKLEHDTEQTENNVLNLENDPSNSDQNVLNLENENTDPDNNMLDLEENKSDLDYNALKPDRDGSPDRDDGKVITITRERSDTSSNSSKSSKKSPGIQTMDSGLDLNITSRNRQDSQ